MALGETRGFRFQDYGDNAILPCNLVHQSITTLGTTKMDYARASGRVHGLTLQVIIHTMLGECVHSLGGGDAVDIVNPGGFVMRESSHACFF